MADWKRIGDRRCFLRFEVLGGLAASLSATETLRVVNLGTRGALVESARPLQADTEYPMRFVLDSHVSDVTVRVRRVTAVSMDLPHHTYLIGIEFLTLTPEAEETIWEVVQAGRQQNARVERAV